MIKTTITYFLKVKQKIKLIYVRLKLICILYNLQAKDKIGLI